MKTLRRAKQRFKATADMSVVTKESLESKQDLVYKQIDAFLKQIAEMVEAEDFLEDVSKVFATDKTKMQKVHKLEETLKRYTQKMNSCHSDLTAMKKLAVELLGE